MKITVASAQYPITFFHNLADWQAHTSAWVAAAVQKGAHIILFPEYGAMELASLVPSDAQQDLNRQVIGLNELRADFIDRFATLSHQWNVIIIAPSFPVIETDCVYNRVFVFDCQGLVGYQDKLFMTRFENEDWGITAAVPVLKVFDTDWGTFGIQTCYDVEFPIGAAVLCAHGAELILAPSCTETTRGATRVHVGARARALENQCYVVVAQTVGNALWSKAVDVNYGYAAIYATPDIDFPSDGIIAQNMPQEPGWLIQTIDLSKTRHVRKAGQVFNFKDHQNIGYILGGKEIQVVRHQVKSKRITN